MAIFFLLIGLELERELYNGELSNFRNALLPIFAAGGGIAPTSVDVVVGTSAFGLGLDMPNVRTDANEAAMGDAARYVERESVAEVVAWLCSPAARDVTGQVLRLGP